ncbi:cytoplasmic polyadenylation element-binding protein 2-like isoform X1 [Lates japonicus]|uniref:Cytoplasmic polyadenylation element-binding protein 2-like isoform X1 n=1 Tax=Lates japonicus TaxID=270547 RepID=A0AAD3N573_LATJO|nr:cytoplasmic polyadenylation element-binding protein 2-like isoform X1 [Lates japonicus]
MDPHHHPTSSLPLTQPPPPPHPPRPTPSPSPSSSDTSSWQPAPFNSLQHLLGLANQWCSAPTVATTPAPSLVGLSHLGPYDGEFVPKLVSFSRQTDTTTRPAGFLRPVLLPGSPFNNVAASSLFLSAAAHQQNMQDEPVGVTTTQLPPSTEEKDSNSRTVSRSGKQPNQTDDSDSQLSSFTQDYNHLNQKTAFHDFDRDHFCLTQSICDLQHSRKIHQQLSQHTEFSPTESSPPLGHFSHLPQRQPFSKPEPSAADPCGSPVEEAETDAASPSPTSVNPNKIQMDSPITHHINNGNGSSSTGNMLSGGLGAAFPNLPAQEMQSASGGSSSPSLPGFGTPWV